MVAPGRTLEDMTVDASIPRADDGTSRHIAARWESTCRRQRHGLDRVAIVTALRAALAGTPADSIRLAREGAVFGSAFTAAGGSLAALVDELDTLESVLLDDIIAKTANGPPPQIASAVRTLHDLAALTRRTSTAAFGHTASAAARKRVRMARHDMNNAIGTVRNAILLMEDGAAESERDHFREIAKRNSRGSEMLVRAHLSDQTALTPAFGWEDASISDVMGISDDTPERSRVVADFAALETMLGVIRVANPQAGKTAGASMSFATSGATSGVLTIHFSTCGDCALSPDIRNGLRDLATAMGLRLEGDDEGRDLRVLFPLLPGNEGHNLGGAGESHNADTIGF